MMDKLYYAFMKKRLKLPISLIFFVTGKCNSHCVHCFYWENLNKDVEELSLAEIEKASKQLGHLMEVNLSGGEPFLRKDIAQICKIFYENNKPRSFSIPTNGLLPDLIQGKVKDILEQVPVPVSINLSLDGTKEVHDEIRGVKGNYEKVIETYERLIQLKNDYANLIIKVTTTLFSRNINNIDSLIKDVKEKMPDIDFHNFEIARGNMKDANYHHPTIEELTRISPLIFEAWKSYSFFGPKNKFKSMLAVRIKRFVFYTYLKILKEKRQVIPCYAYKTSLVLDEKGNAYFCELQPSIGSVRDNTVKEILNSGKAKKQAQFIKNKGCYCTHSCFQQKNIMFNYNLYPKLFSSIIKK